MDILSRFRSQNFIIQVFGLLLLWCLAIYTIYQIRSMSFQTLNIPSAQVDYHLTIYQKSDRLEEDIKSVVKNLDNVPLDYWNKIKDTETSCAKFPNPSTLKFHQTYWQTLSVHNATVHILNAYLDTRKENPDTATVRIIAIVEGGNPVPPMYCQLWFQDQTQPVIVNTVRNTDLWFSQNIEALPYLINCKIPEDFNDQVPVAVSLVEHPCDTASNALKVNYKKSEKKDDFAVCLKGLNEPQKDLSEELIEWIELLSILGVKSVFFYDLDVHPNVRNVLNYYKNKKMADTTVLKLVESSYEIMKMQRDIVPYTDCFYNHMYEFKYIVLIDIDEMLLPAKSKTWKSLLNIDSAGVDINAFYNINNVFFVDGLVDKSNNDIPDYMKMLRNIYKQRGTSGLTVKTFFNTEKVLTLHNDLPVNCLRECTSHKIETDEAHLQHYREDCTETKKNCYNFGDNTEADRRIWNFKETLMQLVVKARQDLAL